MKKEHLCILSERIPWRASIPKMRQCIEQFESYVVSKKFKSDEVYDLQCGLWGFLFPECSNFTISCVGYEIELNVACEAFKKAGKVLTAKVIVDRMTGEYKGFGFVEMSTMEEAKEAMKILDRKELEGRKIAVKEAKPQEARN
mgnify:CR=1 FL=1